MKQRREREVLVPEEVRRFLDRRAPEEAEELAQQVALRLWTAQADLQDDAERRAYAFVVARRLLIDRHRRARRRPPLTLVDQLPEWGHGDDPAAHLAAQQSAERVEAELGRMRPELAEVFRLRWSSDLSFKEIAAHQGVPLNTALGRMHQVIQRLARLFQEDE